jgi:hypothetical protein
MTETTGKDRARVGIGTSEAASAMAAGRQAAAAALAQLAGEPPAMVLVYGSVRYHAPDLLAGVREVTGEAPLAGCSSSGHFHDGGVTPPGRGVAVLAVTAGPYRFGVASVAGLRDDPMNAGRVLARAAKRAAANQQNGADPAPHAAMVLLADGLVGSQNELLTGVYKVAGAAVPVVGGAAGDDRWVRRTGVFHDDLELTGGAVGIWIDSPWPLAIGVGHGWSPLGPPLLVTEVDGSIVREIDGQPAVEVVREQARAAANGRYGERAARHHGPGWLRMGSLRQSGFQPAHAFGLIEPDGTMLVRGAYLHPDGTLRTLAPLPTYAPIQIVSCEPPDMLAVVEPVVARAIAGREPSLVLGFSCTARLDLLGERVGEEAALLHDAAGGAATFGFYTYGEFARTTSAAGYHNATLAALAL